MITDLIKTTTTPAVDHTTGHSHDTDIMFCFELHGGPLPFTTPWMRGPQSYMEQTRDRMLAFVECKINKK